MHMAAALQKPIVEITCEALDFPETPRYVITPGEIVSAFDKIMSS